MTNKTKNTPVVYVDPMGILQALVGLKDINVLCHSRLGPVAQLMIESVVESPQCSRCLMSAEIHQRPIVSYVDLPVFGQPYRLLWKKHRFRCPNSSCKTKTWTHEDHRISAVDCQLTTRAAKWATKQVGESARAVSDVANELHCGWDAVNAAVTKYGRTLLESDRKRLKETTGVGLDETLYLREGIYKKKHFCTTVADVVNGQLIDILPTRDYKDVARWINDQPPSWKDRIHHATLDMSNVYAAVFNVALPDATQIVDRFHVMQLANRYLDQVRRRVQNEQLGHRGRKDDPLYKIRKLLLMNGENLSDEATERLDSLMRLGDPGAEVAIAYQAKEAIRRFYETTSFDEAKDFLETLQQQCSKPSMPPELQQFAGTLKKWFDKILNWHTVKLSNGPTEGLNNLIKRIKRTGFGFRNFANYRIRALLYAGRPNWRVLDSIVVR